ncbi:suppressor of fused domain protein [Saccharibacillus kuerlensis]|nr:suppressor of fused domain protein [Saccharibacillus kuerlensis]
MMINYGELYYDQYSKFLGQPFDREIFENNKCMPNIQVLKYKNVFEECYVYNTLGLSKYDDVIGSNLEVSMVVDEGFDSAAYILANTLYYCLANQMQMGRGVAISGIKNVDHEFAQLYNKDAIYFTDPFAFPEEYSTVLTDNHEKNGRILLAIFITTSEYEYFSKHGADLFEEILESKDVDPFHIRRDSVL